MFKLIRAWKYAANYIKARDYCAEGDYFNAYKRLKKIEKNKLKDRSLIKVLLLEAHTLFKLKDFDESENLLTCAIKELKSAKHLSLIDKQYLLEYVKQHFNITHDVERYNSPILKVDSDLKKTFSLIDDKIKNILLHKPEKLSLYRRLSYICRDVIYKESGCVNAIIWMRATNLTSQGQFFKAYPLVKNFWRGIVGEKRALEYLTLKAYLELGIGKYEEGLISFEFLFSKLEKPSQLNIDERLYLSLFSCQCCSIVTKYINFNIEGISNYNQKEDIIDYSKVSTRLQIMFPLKKSLASLKISE